METLAIGQLAARFALPTHVLRHWESVGVLAPAERVNGRRRYLPGQASRIAMILRAKTAGLSLEQIREVLDAPDLPARRALLRAHHAELERRRRDIEAAQQMVEHALECPAPDFTLCLSFQELVQQMDDDAGPPEVPAPPPPSRPGRHSERHPGRRRR